MDYTELYIQPEDLAKYKIKKITTSIFMYSFMILIAIFILFPFLYMIVGSFKSEQEAIAATFKFFPEKWQFDNYKSVFIKTADGVSIVTMYINTIIVAVISTLATIATTILAAFAFSRLNFKGRDKIFGILLMTMMIPGEIFVITNYLTLSDFKNTYFVLIIPFTVSVFYVFFLRQSFKQIPNELYLAAKVDGVGDFKYLFKVMIPIAKSSIITITILSMIGTWNAYVWPNMMTTDASKSLISNGLINFFSELKNSGQLDKVIPRQMAMSFLVSLPLLIAFMFLRKYIMSGVSRSGIKG